MALDTSIVARIRDEIGGDPDFANNTTDFDPNIHLEALETIYADPDRGNFSILRTALICWRRRLHALQARGFDLTTEGTLLNRNQRYRQIERRIHALEKLIDTTYRGSNQPVQTPAQVERQYGGAEFGPGPFVPFYDD